MLLAASKQLFWHTRKLRFSRCNELMLLAASKLLQDFIFLRVLLWLQRTDAACGIETAYQTHKKGHLLGCNELMLLAASKLRIRHTKKDTY